jgi:hypothetical protein
MKYVALALTATLLATANARAQEPWAEKMFEKGTTTHDFGNVPRGAQLLHQFKITNIFNAPLEISLSIACGCVTGKPSPRVLEPNQTGTIDIVMDTQKVDGFKSVKIYVSVGPQFVSTATLTVSATGRRDVVLNPGGLDFGIVTAGRRTVPQSLDVDYAGAFQWNITGLDTEGAPLTATYQERYRQPGRGVGYRIEVSLKPDIPPGPFKSKIIVKTNDPATPFFPLNVEGKAQASLAAVPDVVALGTLKPGESIQKLVMVKSTRPFRLLSVEGTGDGVSAALPVNGGPVQVVTITFKPTKAGVVNKQLTFKTDLDKDPQISVKLQGAVEQ